MDSGLVRTRLHEERANLTVRLYMRRFTRLANGFSKKLENQLHAISLHFMFYNFCKIHKTLGVTPAMDKIDDHVRTIKEAVAMADTNPDRSTIPHLTIFVSEFRLYVCRSCSRP